MTSELLEQLGSCTFETSATKTHADTVYQISGSRKRSLRPLLNEFQGIMITGIELNGRVRQLSTALTQKKFITRKQAALILGVSIQTVFNWPEIGILQGYEIGKCVRYIED